MSVWQFNLHYFDSFHIHISNITLWILKFNSDDDLKRSKYIYTFHNRSLAELISFYLMKHINKYVFKTNNKQVNILLKYFLLLFNYRKNDAKTYLNLTKPKKEKWRQKYNLVSWGDFSSFLTNEKMAPKHRWFIFYFY